MADKKFYIVFNSRGDDGKIHGAHIVSSSIPGTQDLMEQKSPPATGNLDCSAVPTTRYLYRETAKSADKTPLCGNSPNWANYEIDPNDEATPYATFEEADVALKAAPAIREESL